MAAMLTPLAWAPTWRSHPKRYKFMSDIQANNSSAEMATDLKFEKYSTIAHSFQQSIYEDNDEKRRRLQPTRKDHKNITSSNQRLVKCVPSLVKVFYFYFIDCAEKIIGVFSSRRPRKHLQVRSRLFVPHGQPASKPVQNGAQCLRNQSIKPSRVIFLKTTGLVCVPLRRTQLYDEATFSLEIPAMQMQRCYE